MVTLAGEKDCTVVSVTTALINDAVRAASRGAMVYSVIITSLFRYCGGVCDGRPPSLSAEQAAEAVRASYERERLGHQNQVRQPLQLRESIIDR